MNGVGRHVIKRPQKEARSYTDTVQAADSTVQLLRFGAFELDLQNSELRRAGVLLKTTPQQFQVLRLLAENAGQVQTREAIQREIWGADTFGDLDRSLNVCVAQIRSILGDDSDAPRFIQTIPKRGYRFVAPVERVPTLAGTADNAVGFLARLATGSCLLQSR